MGQMEGKEVHVVHKDQDIIHRRKIKYSSDLRSLKRAMFSTFADLLVPKIADSTGMSEVEVKDTKIHDEIAEKVLYFSVYDQEARKHFELVNADKISATDDVCIEVKDYKKINPMKLEVFGGITLPNISEPQSGVVSTSTNGKSKMEKPDKPAFGRCKIFLPFDEQQRFIMIADATTTNPDLFNIKMCKGADIGCDHDGTGTMKQCLFLCNCVAMILCCYDTVLPGYFNYFSYIYLIFFYRAVDCP